MEIRDVICAGGVLTHKHSKEGRMEGSKEGKYSNKNIVFTHRNLKIEILF